LVTHHEVISIGELLCTADYSPTVGYVYNPCLKAKSSLQNLQLGQPVTHFRVMNSSTLQGFDEVGVLLVHETGSLWHGTTLNCSEARRLVPFNSATSLQVVAGIIGALTWMFDNPRAGVVEAESLDSEKILDTAKPYLGKVSTVETDWRPDIGIGFSGVSATDVAELEPAKQIEKV
jgi:homospermidine synthase